MKNLLRTFALLLIFITGRAHAQHDHNSKLASVDIHSNAVCSMCETTIETEMLYVKGVQSVKLNLDSNLIHVDYKPNKTNPDKLRQAVSKLGYMADDVTPDPEARKALPDCCQAEGCGMPGEKKMEHPTPVPPVPPTPEEPAAPETPEP